MSFSKQFTKREKVLLVLLAVLLLAACYYWFVQQPIANELERIEMERSEAQAEQIVLDAKAQRLEEMRAELELLFAQPGGLAETPAYDNLQNIITQFNAILASASEYNLNFQPVEMPEEGNVVRRVINMNFTCGSYAVAQDMVQRLHDGPYRCQIGPLAIAPAATVGADGASLNRGPVQVSLTITYFEII